jgi:hypothetical protein
MSEETTKYQKEWEDYKNRRKMFWLFFVLFIPFFALLSLLFSKLFGTYTVGSVPIAFIFLGIVFVILINKLRYWKCPHCGKPFFRTWWENNLTDKCIHCDLPKYYGSSFYRENN